MNKPNILFILSDDHGQWASGCYGNDEVLTPNIDNLAKEGMLFNNFHCTSPVCSPARASILTGKIPSQHGVHDWIDGGNISREKIKNTEICLKTYLKMCNLKERDALLSGRSLDEVPNEEKIKICKTDLWNIEMNNEKRPITFLKNLITFPEVLNTNGYFCGLSGKWHLGNTFKKQCGFQYWETVARGGCDYMYPEIITDDKYMITEQYITEYVTDKAIEFLNIERNDKPFLLSVNYTAPHSPWNKESHPKEIWDLYENIEIDDTNLDTLHPDICYTAPTPKCKKDIKLLKKGYYTAITAMDLQIGRILKELKKLDLEKDTIVIYTSDNGMNLGQHGVWGKGNGTYPQNFYESSIKVPFIIKGDGIASNYKNYNMYSQYDIFPTLIDLCNINYEFDESFPGKSMLSALNGNQLEKGNACIYDEYGPNRMIKSQKYKLINHYQANKQEFYNLEVDTNETENLAIHSENKGIISLMDSDLIMWFQRYGNQKYNDSLAKCEGVGQIELLSNRQDMFNDLKTHLGKRYSGLGKEKDRLT